MQFICNLLFCCIFTVFFAEMLNDKKKKNAKVNDVTNCQNCLKKDSASNTVLCFQEARIISFFILVSLYFCAVDFINHAQTVYR